MAADYAYINNYKNLGKLGIHRRVFEAIALQATNEVEGANVFKKNSGHSVFRLKNDISCLYRKDGKVDIKIPVVIRKNCDVNAICIKIQETVATYLMSMCEMVPFKITVNIAAIE